MAITYRTVTGNLADLLRADFDPASVRITVRTNLADGDAPVDLTNGQILLGTGRVTIASDGTFSTTNVIDHASTDVNPTGIQYRWDIDFTPRNAQRATSWSSGFVSVTADATLATLVEEQYVPPTYQSAFIAQAEDLLAQQEAIAGLATSDAAQAYNVENGPLTGAALSASSGPIMDRSTKTTFYDDFTTKADAVIASGGSYVSQSGHTVQVTGQLALTVASGRGTSVRTNTATVQSTYLTADLAIEAADDVGYLYVDAEVPAGADPLASLGLIIPTGTFGPPDFTDCSNHCIFGDSAFHDSSLQALGAGAFTSTTLGRGQYTTLVPGTYRFEVTLDGRTATVTDPYGKRWPCDASDFNVTRTNGHVTLQWYANVGTFKGYKVLGWGAELQRRAKHGSYAAASDLAKVATQPGRTIAAVQSSGASTATAMLTSLSTKLMGQFIPIPVSRRILVEANLWFDESVPVVRSASALLVGAYLGGGTTYGKLTTVQSGYTPANATLDPLSGSKTHDWASLADGAMASTTVTVTGAALGGMASASMNVALPAGMQLTAAVTAADTVTVTLLNHSGSTQDLASGTLRAAVQPTPTAYATGKLVPFAVRLDIDPAFAIGDLIEVQIKAQASATSLFTFVDSGDASGGTSTLRRSTLKITELAPA